MQRTLIVVTVLAACLLSGSASAAGQERDVPTVVTSGEAIIRAAPDRAFVMVEAETRAPSPAAAQRQNAQVMTAVQSQVKAAGLPADAIRTLGYNVQPEFDYRDGRRILRGYLASNSIEIRLDDITRTGEIIDVAVKAGATSVGGVRFDLKNRDEVERLALRQAVADARARAEAAAAGAGRSIARILRIEEQRAVSYPPPRPMIAMRAEAAAEAPSTPIVAGELEVRANVTLAAQLQ